MNALSRFCPDDTTVLLAANVLVQIAVVAALAWMLSLILARRSPALRHGIWFSAFACVLISPAMA